MAPQGTEVVLPADLVREIDETVGADKREAFLTELARSALKSHHLLQILRGREPIWKDEDHPELAAMGTAAWVRSIRQEGEEQLARISNER